MVVQCVLDILSNRQSQRFREAAKAVSSKLGALSLPAILQLYEMMTHLGNYTLPALDTLPDGMEHYQSIGKIGMCMGKMVQFLHTIDL